MSVVNCSFSSLHHCRRHRRYCWSCKRCSAALAEAYRMESMLMSLLQQSRTRSVTCNTFGNRRSWSSFIRKIVECCMRYAFENNYTQRGIAFSIERISQTLHCLLKGGHTFGAAVSNAGRGAAEPDGGRTFSDDKEILGVEKMQMNHPNVVDSNGVDNNGVDEEQPAITVTRFRNHNTTVYVFLFSTILHALTRWWGMQPAFACLRCYASSVYMY